MNTISIICCRVSTFLPIFPSFIHTICNSSLTFSKKQLLLKPWNLLHSQNAMDLLALSDEISLFLSFRKHPPILQWPPFQRSYVHVLALLMPGTLSMCTIPLGTSRDNITLNEQPKEKSESEMARAVIWLCHPLSHHKENPTHHQ